MFDTRGGRQSPMHGSDASHDCLQQNPFATANSLIERTRMTAPTVNSALAELAHLEIVAEITGRRSGRVFAYRNYLDILDEGTTPAPAEPAR